MANHKLKKKDDKTQDADLKCLCTEWKDTRGHLLAQHVCVVSISVFKQSTEHNAPECSWTAVISAALKSSKAQLAVSNFSDVTTTGSIVQPGLEQTLCAVEKYRHYRHQCKKQMTAFFFVTTTSAPNTNASQLIYFLHRMGRKSLCIEKSLECF